MKLLALSDEQIELLKKLLGPSCDIDHPSISNEIWDRLDHATEELTFISVYECTETYGGPEEGGWWYWHKTLTSTCSFFTNEGMRAYLINTIKEYQDMPDNELPTEQFPSPDIFDEDTEAVVYQDNPYHAHFIVKLVVESFPGEHQTVRRPFYE